MTEDRGWTAYVWKTNYLGDASFGYFQGDVENEMFPHKHEVSVPIGWSFAADPAHGIVLRHTLASRGTLTAEDAYGLASDGKDGFRLKS